MSEELLQGGWAAGDIVHVDAQDGELVFTKTRGQIPEPRKREHLDRAGLMGRTPSSGAGRGTAAGSGGIAAAGSSSSRGPF